MTSEDWNNLLFTSLDHWIDERGTSGGVFAIYFVIGVSFGSCIYPVIITIMLVHFILVRQYVGTVHRYMQSA